MTVRITVVEGDITTQDVDAVVNAASRAMRGGAGVDGAIHRAGGPEVLEDCRRRFPRGLATGDAGWTTAGRLQAQWVIHVVGPNHSAGETDRSLLTSCYANALQVADELGALTVAFPLVSAGIYVPFELYYLVRQPSLTSASVLAINLAVLWLLWPTRRSS